MQEPTPAEAQQAPRRVRERAPVSEPSCNSDTCRTAQNRNSVRRDSNAWLLLDSAPTVHRDTMDGARMARGTPPSQHKDTHPITALGAAQLGGASRCATDAPDSF
eukprot:SAG11_NODE_1537_length_4724_cov_4.318270_4_plen_105_part_00